MTDELEERRVLGDALIERGDPLGEVAEHDRVLGEIRADDLDRDVALQLAIVRAVHGAHPAGADQLRDEVAPDLVAGAQGVLRLPTVQER